MKRPESRVIPTLDDLVFPGSGSVESENEPTLSADLQPQDLHTDPALLDPRTKIRSKKNDSLKQEPQFPSLKTSEDRPNHEPGLPPITQLTSRVSDTDPDYNVPFLKGSAHYKSSEENRFSHTLDSGSTNLKGHATPAEPRTGIDLEENQTDHAVTTSNHSDHSSFSKSDLPRESNRPAAQQNHDNPRTFARDDEIHSDAASSNVPLTTGYAGNQNTQELEKLIHKALGDVLEIEIPLLEQRLVKAISKEISKKR